MLAALKTLLNRNNSGPRYTPVSTDMELRSLDRVIPLNDNDNFMADIFDDGDETESKHDNIPLAQTALKLAFTQLQKISAYQTQHHSNLISEAQRISEENCDSVIQSFEHKKMKSITDLALLANAFFIKAQIKMGIGDVDAAVGLYETALTYIHNDFNPFIRARMNNLYAAALIAQQNSNKDLAAFFKELGTFWDAQTINQSNHNYAVQFHFIYTRYLLKQSAVQLALPHCQKARDILLTFNTTSPTIARLENTIEDLTKMLPAAMSYAKSHALLKEKNASAEQPNCTPQVLHREEIKL